MCGALLYDLADYEYELPEGWDAMCFITDDDVDRRDQPCADLLVDLTAIDGGGAQELLDAGGSFGCMRGKDGVAGDYTDACRSQYQETITLSDCEECNILAVCMRFP